ncbi:multicopper oxidase domain-containing protein [Amycolatopsis sp. NPDC049688]|uniref:multicopper oxidase family protein n=1 Tax=Amycolatopsis sp. NPDC049688 TaxID=3154733 RepID=UPI00342CFE59
MLNRRKMLGWMTAGGVAGGAALLPSALTAGAAPAEVDHTGHTAAAGAAEPAARRSFGVTQFTQVMPVPQTLTPVKRADGTETYRIPIQTANFAFTPGKPTPVRTFGGQFLGPLIRAKTGTPVEITFCNQLTAASNVHLHGGHNPQVSDGYPMDLIQPGQSRTYRYPNQQQGATLWYHDHSHGTEAENVYKGLHGFYILDDDAEKGLNLPSGQYDVPIMLRDAQIDADGALVWPNFAPDRTTVLTNGVVAPYFPVAARKYRFRLLNTGNERGFRLTLGGLAMTQIGSDGGLLPAPVTRSDITFTSGERVDIVVDFSNQPIGSKFVLSDVSGPVLRFDVTRTASDTSRVPATLRPLPALGTATVQRQVTMKFDDSGNVGLVNDQAFDVNRVDFQVKRGATEIWTVTNTDTVWGAPHTFHLHLEQFRVLDRNGAPPTPDDAGRKDTVLIMPGESIRVQATFTEYTGKYVYHCHFLDHSAIGMMAQMEIVP